MGKNVTCPLCGQGVYVEGNDSIALCGDDVHITRKQLDKMLNPPEDAPLTQHRNRYEP
jgi:hypothetical protein